MSGVIDLGQYLRLLIKWSWLIGLITLIGLIAGLLFALTRPTRWQSAATVLVKPAPANVTVSPQTTTQRIDPITISAIIPDLPARTLVLVANQSAVEQVVQRQLCERPEDKYPARLCEPGAMLGHVMVQEIQGRPNVLEVIATDSNRAYSQEMANVWAAVASDYINSLLAAGYFDAERALPEKEKAREQWQVSQAELTKFESTSNLPSVGAQYAASQSLLSDYLRQSNQITQNLNSAALLRTQLQRSKGSEASSLPVLLLSLSTFTTEAADVDVSTVLPNLASGTNIGSGASTSSQGVQPQQPQQSQRAPRTSSVLVQPTLDALGSLTREEQVAFLDSLTIILRQKQAQLQASIKTLNQQIGDLRGQFDQLGAQRDQLVSNRDRDRTLYDTLNNLIQQQQVGAQIQSDKVEVVGRAMQPQQAGVRGVLPVILGGVLGLMLGVLLAFLMEFARGARRGISSFPVRTTDQGQA